MKKRLALFAATVAMVLVAAPAAMATTVHVYRPHTAHYYYSSGSTINVWGYVTPKFKSVSNKTLKIYIYRRNSSGTYYRYRISTAKLYRSSSYSYSTRYKRSVKISRTGHYRMRARLHYKDSSGKWHTKWSIYHYVRVTS